MKKKSTLILTLISILLFVDSVFAQNKDSIKALAEAAIKSFIWDIEKSDKGTLMFLDVPYTRENHDSAEYLSLIVAKNKSEKRPEFISVIIPNNIVQSNGIFVKFANTVTKKGKDREMVMEKGNPKRINFERCNNEDCTARIIGSYLTDEKTNEKIDIFQNFLDFDYVLFLFIYPDGSHKSVAVPLFSFKQQYKTL